MTTLDPPQTHEQVAQPATRPPADALPSLNAPAKGAGARFWLVATVLCLVAGGGTYLAARYNLLPSFGGKGPSKAAPKSTPVVTAVARQGDLNIYLSSIGTVTAFQTVTVRSRVDGELMKVAFTEGQMVHEGDLLAEIDPRPFEVQQAQAEGQLARDQATLNQGNLDLQRDEKLAAQKAVSPQQLDAQRATVGQFAGAVKADQAMIDNAKLQQIYCRIKAPISGRIGLRLVDKGNFVQASNPAGLAVITQLQPIAVIFTVTQDEILRVQQKSRSVEGLVVEAYDRDMKQRLATGKLMAIDNQVDLGTGTVKLKARFDNEDNALFPNQFVNARLLIETRHNAVIVPAAAIQRGPRSTFVYVVQPDQRVELRNVVAGPTEADQTIVESGMSAGETVVIEGTDKLQPDSKVEVRDNKSGAKSKAGEPLRGSGKSGRRANKAVQ